MQFIWRPYLDGNHEPNEADAAIWTSTTAIIRYNIVEMHQTDRVKLQFGMHQEIPGPPTHLGEWHLKRVNHQWYVESWKEFAPEWCRMWKNRAQYVLQVPINAGEMKPSRRYMSWYRSITSPELFVSDPYYLIDPRQQQFPDPQQEEPEQQQEEQHHHNPQETRYQPNYQTPNYQPYHPSQTQSQPPYQTLYQDHFQHNTPFQTHSQPEYQTLSHQPRPSHRRTTQYQEAGSSRAQLSPDMGPQDDFDPVVAQPSHQRTPYGYATPSQTFAFFPGSSSAGEYYQPQIVPQPPPPQPFQNFEGMGNRLYDSRFPGRYGDDFLDSEVREDIIPGPSTQQPQEPPMRRARVRRPPRCGTGGRYGDERH